MTIPPREVTEAQFLADLIEQGEVVPWAVACADCGHPMKLALKILRDFGRFELTYRCTGCSATHGAFENGEPLGVPGDQETRAARIKAHEALDQLWRGAASMYPDLPEDPGDKVAAIRRLENVARSRAYAWLAERLQLPRDECHIGKFDATTCELVVLVLQGVGPHQVREWAKARR